jgi:hypothetical protein
LSLKGAQAVKINIGIRVAMALTAFMVNIGYSPVLQRFEFMTIHNQVPVRGRLTNMSLEKQKDACRFDAE